MEPGPAGGLAGPVGALLFSKLTEPPEGADELFSRLIEPPGAVGLFSRLTEPPWWAVVFERFGPP
jgi:hypothetical protein